MTGGVFIIAHRIDPSIQEFFPENFPEFSHQIIVNNEDECPICYESGGIFCKLPCKHEFHLNCMKQYLKINPHASKCPYCRASI
jgi:hypothetical protein